MKIPINPFSEDSEDLGAQHSYLTLAVICLFILILLRLWYLQIVRGYEYRAMSENNRTRVQDLAPPRGLILDRNGIILVDNFPSYELAVIREDVSDVGGLSARLAYLLGAPLKDIQDRFEEIKTSPAFKPIRLLSGLNREDLAAVETNRFELPGIVVRVKPQRRYLYNLLAAHVIGYLGEINQDQLGHEKYSQHRIGDLAGQYGIERDWENYLHGKRGERIVEVDASGRVLRILKEKAPETGDNLFLTLDLQLQQVAQQALGDKAGAIAVVSPHTGEVLAMASSPSFNQNDFVSGISIENWKNLIENPLRPLENRAVSGQYPPGSTFKIIPAAGALEEGMVNEKTTVLCNGAYPFGDRVFHCWKRGGHGRVNLHQAIKGSCDIYFYDLSRKLGINNISLYSQLFGLGRKSGIGLSNEKPGLTPSREWKKRRYNIPWQAGETLSVVIGQGYNLATPLQMAQVTAATANGGTLYRPHLISKITQADGRVIKQFEPEVVSKLDFKPETWKAIQRGMEAVVNEQGGTGRRARLDDVIVAGKTGTSQVVALSRYRGMSKKELPYEYQDHAWFVAFAPLENPQIAVAVVMEHAGGGGAAAAPVAKIVLDAYFHPDREPQIMDAPLPAITAAAQGD